MGYSPDGGGKPEVSGFVRQGRWQFRVWGVGRLVHDAPMKGP